MKKGNRKISIRRETLCVIDNPEVALVEGGIWPPLPPRTQYGCPAL